MDLVEAMETQRAIRRLKPDPVDDEVLLRCLRLASKAPTGGNRQGVEWILVRDRERKAALGRQYRVAWSVYGGAGRLLHGRTTRAPVERSTHVDRYGNRPFAEATATAKR
jgi:nitroreductase